MADDRWLSWQAEYAGTNWMPPVSLVFLVFALVTVLLLSALGGPDAVAEPANRGKPPTLCAEHAGRPGWAAVCPPRSVPVKHQH